MKTAELTGALLDYWVAQAEGWPAMIFNGVCEDLLLGGKFQPSTKWGDGGSILERMRPLEIVTCIGREGWYVRSRQAPCNGDQFFGETLLVATMRAYVASKFGPDVLDATKEAS